MKITEKIVDLATGEETIVERDETAAEKLEREKSEAEAQARAIAQTEAESKRLALLAKLGITQDEAKLLLS